jgi:proteasome lid subunit RPN8/RPN11
LIFKVLYHSHPEHDAYFSEEDTRMALFDGETPIYPETSYLVVSVYDKKVRDQALFSWNPETKTFERAPD